MSWVRIHDGAMTHPKIIGLSDKAFRLWIWGLSYCQQHLTDGFIPAAAVGAGLSRIATLLVLARLWDAREDGGYQVHDYLDWNDGRALVNKRQIEARERMAKARERSSLNVRENALERTSQEVPLRFGLSSGSVSERKSEGKPYTAEQLQLRAGAFLQRYAELFYQHRHGAKYHNRMHLDFPKACELVQTWTDDARLEKLATIVLTTNDEWISGTDRGFAVFVSRASWADARLAEWEKNGGGS